MRKQMTVDSGNNKKRNSLAQVAYNAVFDMILSRELAGGTVIQERKLADALAISRTPMREALIRLEGEGWLVRLTDRLLSVKIVNMDEYLQALSVRLLLEAEAIERATERLPTDRLEDLRAQIEDLKQDPEPNSAKHWDFDDALHNTIAEASGNQVMAQIIRELRSITRLFEGQTVPQRQTPGLVEHEAIIQALEAGDAKQARDCMIAHLNIVRAGVLDSF